MFFLGFTAFVEATSQAKTKIAIAQLVVTGEVPPETLDQLYEKETGNYWFIMKTNVWNFST